MFWGLIGDSHDGQISIDVCRLVAMVIWSWTSNVAYRGQNAPVHVGLTPIDTIGPRSRSRLSARYVLVVLKWRMNRGIFKARRVFSFDIVITKWLISMPASRRVRCLRVLTHSRLATMIINVSVTFENLPIVWMAYKREWMWDWCHGSCDHVSGVGDAWTVWEVCTGG